MDSPLQRKRGYGNGTIFLRKDGRWVATVMIARKTYTFYGKTRKEVQEKLTEAIEQHREIQKRGRQLSVEQFFILWLDNLPGPMRDSTRIRYEQLVRTYIIPELGSLPLIKLTPQRLETLYCQLIEDEISSSTVRLLHACIHTALEQAINWNYLQFNVSNKVVSPSRATGKIHPFTQEQAQKFLNAIRGYQLEPLFALALATGMQKGELLALRWSDIDLYMGALQVHRAFTKQQGGGYLEIELKADADRRTIVIAPFALETLQQYRTFQLETKMGAGRQWQETGFVFCTATGESLHPAVVGKQFRQVLKDAELPLVRFLDLRHTTATLLLKMGCQPQVVQELLGYSRLGDMFRLYGSYYLSNPDLQKEAVDLLNRHLQQ